ncbi:hypothetical protein PHISCL_07480 [Aspergillus sclerotialis]|uniref:Uncharacterized protein n=1 Tax=Aspergillus sclerotialis TaxID=2070753 RepID=A0A3A2ZAP3_9EURO|nr:hypothetical protein PHISCL_07480 [Aspergillus sclerotialis]
MSQEPYAQQVLSLIQSADLENTEHKLLTFFIEDAVDPTRAAKYISNRIELKGSNSKEQVLRSISHDWKRLLERCMCFVPVYLALPA